MTTTLNPDDYVITRKRKKYKFAKFHNATNCYEFDEWMPRAIDVVELGAGTGLFALELAACHSDRQFAAVDVKADRLQKGAYEALARGIDNIVFIRARADQIDQLFVSHSLSALWLTFADPFPRERSAGRRMSHPAFLAKYSALLSSGGRLYFKHDNLDFFQWSLEQLVANQWRITELSFNLHESYLPDEYKIYTTYEQRWLSEGKTIYMMTAYRPMLDEVPRSQ